MSAKELNPDGKKKAWSSVHDEHTWVMQQVNDPKNTNKWFRTRVLTNDLT